MNNSKRRPEPPFRPDVMQRLALWAAAGSAVVLGIGLTLVLLSAYQPVWYLASWLAFLVAAGGWNLRTYLQLRSGRHWSQQPDGLEGGE